MEVSSEYGHLILARKHQESIRLYLEDGRHIEVTQLTDGGRTRTGIRAPKSIRIERIELGDDYARGANRP